MMNTSTAFKPAFAIVGLPGVMILITAVIAMTPSLFSRDPSLLSFAITFDLAVSVPIVYLLLIRNRNVPRITAVPFFVGGIFLAGMLLPEGERRFLDFTKEWILPVIETLVISVIVYKVRKARIAYKKLQGPDSDFLTGLREVSREIIPGKISRVFAGEIALLYYCFMAWRKPRPDANAFTGHRENGTIALLGGLLTAIVVEATAVHFLIGRWSGVAAWIFTSLSIYCALQVLGMIKSISRRPILLKEHMLYVRSGLFGDTTIDLADIEAIELVAKDTPIDPQKIKRLSLLNHNTLIHLKRENLIEGLYGMTKTYRSLALYVDDNKRFKESLSAAMQRRTGTSTDQSKPRS